MLCWLPCKGKQVDGARRGAKEGKSLRVAAWAEKPDVSSRQQQGRPAA